MNRLTMIGGMMAAAVAAPAALRADELGDWAARQKPAVAPVVERCCCWV